MTPTHDELTAAIQTARGIQEMARSGDFIKRPLLTEDRPTLVSVDAFSAAERFAVLCEDILSAMPAPEPAKSLAETVYKTIIEPHAQKHVSIFGRENMPARSERPAPAPAPVEAPDA